MNVVGQGKFAQRDKQQTERIFQSAGQGQHDAELEDVEAELQGRRGAVGAA